MRDSAGVEIVHNADLGPARATWQLSQRPLLTFGRQNAGDPAGMFRVVGAQRLRDGRVVIANSGTNELKLYASDGRFLKAVGGSGSGPGEFRELTQIFLLPPDSILVYDASLERLSVFDSRGRYTRSFRFDSSIDPIVFPAGVLPNGDLLALNASHMVALANEGVNVDSALIIRFDRDGALVQQMGRFAQNWRYRKRSGDLQTVLPIPLSPRGQLLISREGYCHTTGETFSLRCYDLDGVPHRIIDLDYELIPTTEAMVEKHFEEQWRNAPENRRRAIMRLRQELPIPDHLPAIASASVDAAGNFWLQEYPDIGAPVTHALWRIFSPNGRLISQIEMPRRFAPFEIGVDFVIGAWRDDLDVEYVGVYCLSKATGECGMR